MQCNMPKRAVCDLESIDGWRRVTNVDDRVDREGWTVMRSHGNMENTGAWSLCVVEITFYSMRSCTLNLYLIKPVICICIGIVTTSRVKQIVIFSNSKEQLKM